MLSHLRPRLYRPVFVCIRLLAVTVTCLMSHVSNGAPKTRLWWLSVDCVEDNTLSPNTHKLLSSEDVNLYLKFREEMVSVCRQVSVFHAIW